MHFASINLRTTVSQTSPRTTATLEQPIAISLYDLQNVFDNGS